MHAHRKIVSFNNIAICQTFVLMDYNCLRRVRLSPIFCSARPAMDGLMLNIVASAPKEVKPKVKVRLQVVSLCESAFGLLLLTKNY